MKRAGLTLLESIVVVVIIGVLATMAINIYNTSLEKGRAAEAYAVFAEFRAGYKQAEMDGLCVSPVCGWNPDIGAASDPSWAVLGMQNPNADPNGFFTYDFWDTPFSAGSAPVSASRNVIISFHRIDHLAYTNNLDNTMWIYMDLDTGEIFRSSHYQ